ncbi:MAG: YeeE/YedE family protein [Melioribacteraceae bacterium]|nr:YeeE/YedE family protein [Melioribacteraceae bacterium]MCF8353316.1 YeeE/YedE family protein [Melioribacteraceae bacterium]MCF8393180.1 YeeE/YedE family protein [Melioribacteraceae bacterium]MCF8419042.1 YeeE/YedE family protein [Melioribacteraceae bacterium]
MTSLTHVLTKFKTAAGEKSHEHVVEAKPYSNPYYVGVGLGLVLLAAFVIMGRGLGASGALSTVTALTVNTVAPSHAEGNQFYQGYLGDGTTNPLKDWLVFEVLGVLAGGFLSGIFAGRIKVKVEKGPRISSKKRLVFAFLGGALMGFGAKLARGCTSGQALTGGALLNLGSWAFMMAVFAGAYAFAYFMRRQWT